MTSTADADSYGLEQLLDDRGRDVVGRTREFLAKEIEPVINRYWTREEFPHELIPGLAALGITGLAYDGGRGPVGPWLGWLRRAPSPWWAVGAMARATAMMIIAVASCWVPGGCPAPVQNPAL